jgi:nicotinate-nucleotide pyrophosphorylase (carboxylating)
MRHPALEQDAFSPMTATQAASYAPLVAAALAEDGATNDVTSVATIDTGVQACGALALRSPAVVAGLRIAALTFSIVDPNVIVDLQSHDGEWVGPRELASISGAARSLLAAERVALNLLGRMSGVATLTKAFVGRVEGLPVRICDTRKTTPGLRALERYAVRAGGGYNHRFNLCDAVLIKDNHLAAAGSVGNAVERARRHVAEGCIIEVECESLEQVADAVRAGADAILLDNMSLENLRRAVAEAHGHAVLEASGGVTLDNVRDIALTGVDVISVGALTHSARAADVALDFEAAVVAKGDHAV